MLVTQPRPLLFFAKNHFIQVSIKCSSSGWPPAPLSPFSCPAGTASCLSLQLQQTHKTVYFILTKKRTPSWGWSTYTPTHFAE